MTERRQDPANELGSEHRRDREGELGAIHHEERHERVPAALQRRETEAHSRAQHHSIPCAEGRDPDGDNEDQKPLDKLFDEADLDIAQNSAAFDEEGLEQRGSEDPYHPRDQEGGQDPAWRKGRAGIVVQVPDQPADRDHKAPQEDDRG